MSMPKKYIDEIRQTPGVKEASWATWFGGKNPSAEHEFFMTIGVEPETYLQVYDEYAVSPEVQQAFQTDKQAALIGPVLANKFGWKVGDTVRIDSSIYPGEWNFHVVGIYDPKRKSAPRDAFLFDWDYLNDAVPDRQKDMIGWIGTRVEPGRSAAEMSKVIDARFDEKDVQTLSQDESSFMRSFLGMMSTILAAMDIVGIVILGIMMLILGNTVAMGVRERVREYGIMRAVGFLPGHVVTLVLAEAATLGLIGGLAGVAIAVPVVAGMGGFLEENMAAFFPIFRLQAVTAVVALVIAIVLGGLAGVVPAWQASRMKVIEALRNVA
jgi:putative ABC transport system permease protein